MRKGICKNIAAMLVAFCILFTGLPLMAGMTDYGYGMSSYAATEVDKKANIKSQKKARELIAKYADVEAYKEFDMYKMTESEKKYLQNLARSAIKGCSNDYEKIHAIYTLVAQNIFYKKDQKNIPKNPYNTWEKKYGVCHNYASMSKCLLNYSGIPCIFISSDIKSELSDHAYNAAYDRQKKRWIYFDACWGSYNKYDNKNWKSRKTSKTVWFRGTKIKEMYFDMTAEKAASIQQHGISRIENLTDCGGDIEYELYIPKDKWENTEKWTLMVRSIKSDSLKTAKISSNLAGIPVTEMKYIKLRTGSKLPALQNLIIPGTIEEISFSANWYPKKITVYGKPPKNKIELYRHVPEGSKLYYPCTEEALWKAYLKKDNAYYNNGASYVRNHKNTRVVSEKKPTASKDGYKEYKCDLCGKQFRKVIPATGEKNKTTDNSEISRLKAELAEAEAELAEAKKALTKSSKNSSKAESEVAAAKKKLDAAQAVYDQGSLGFFRSVNNSKAVKVIEDRVESQDSASGNWGRTEPGVKGDATDLENMKASFVWIRECNSLRASDKYNSGNNKKNLKVSDTMMAIAQVQANASSVVKGHSNLYNVGENLAWGYKDPFSGWYTDEQKIWLETRAENSSTGHYLNIANPNDKTTRRYAVTGFAYVTKKGTRYGKCHGQTFMVASGGPADGDRQYTIDAYEARFDKYYSKVTADLASAKAAYDKSVKALEQLNNSDTASKSAKEAVERSEAKVKAIKEKLEKATSRSV